jgi:hypothetical protein
MSPTRKFCLAWLNRNGWTLDAEWPSGRVSISKGETVRRAQSIQVAYSSLRYGLDRWIAGMPPAMRIKVRDLMARTSVQGMAARSTDEIIQAMARRKS